MYSDSETIKIEYYNPVTEVRKTLEINRIRTDPETIRGHVHDFLTFVGIEDVD